MGAALAPKRMREIGASARQRTPSPSGLVKRRHGNGHSRADVTELKRRQENCNAAYASGALEKPVPVERDLDLEVN